jgi:hypothetical protein
MTDGKQPMQADGSGGVGEELAEDRGPPSAGRPDMEDNAGDSGGGAYPNPHDRETEGADKEEEFRGGQSVQGYYGDGQLGDEKLRENANAPSDEE